jgi:hypothetical protein
MLSNRAVDCRSRNQANDSLSTMIVQISMDLRHRFVRKFSACTGDSVRSD